jgi:PAS domain S-box-containing protein
MHLTNFDLDNYLKELETIVNMDSGSSYPEGVAKVADFFIKKYKELGCYTDKVNLSPRIGPCVRVLTKHTDRFDVLLVGHMDTVFPEGTTLKRPFRIKDRIAYGPGVVDMKAGLLSAYYVIKEWMSQKNREGSICLLMNSDEEIGSVYSTPWIKEHAAKSKVAFVLEPARSDGSFVIERKGTAKFEVIFRGVSAHAGVDPEKGKSAIVEMARWILELDELNDYEKGLTLNTGTVTGGTVVNMVANHAVMKLDTRFKNPVYEKITGRSRGELLKNTITSITHPEDVVQEGLHLEQLQSGLVDSYTMEKRYIKPDGSIVWVQLVTARLDLNNHSDYSHICIVQDITKQKAFEAELYESERSKSVLLKNLPGMAYRCLFVPEYTMTFVSEGVYDVTGYKSENLINNKDLSFSDLIVPEYRVRIWNEWLKAIKNKTPFKQEYEIITKNGERKWVWEMGQGIFGQDGKVEALEGIVVDISDRKEQELRVQYLIEHDNVTGLYNRNRLEELLTADKGRSGKRALVKINLSKIHLLTITYGYNYSTELTQKVAKALSSLCSEECMLFSTHSSPCTRFV